MDTNQDLFHVANLNDCDISFTGDVYPEHYSDPFLFERVYSPEYNTTRYYSLDPNTGLRINQAEPEQQLKRRMENVKPGCLIMLSYNNNLRAVARHICTEYGWPVELADAYPDSPGECVVLPYNASNLDRTINVFRSLRLNMIRCETVSECVGLVETAMMSLDPNVEF